MKRTIVLIRHAKTHPVGPLQRDYDRALTGRGEQDAAAMGRRLHEQRLRPAMIIASPARRAEQTALLIAAATGFEQNQIHWEPQLYLAAPPAFEQTISLAPDEAHTLFIVAHNPGITDFANELSPAFSIDHLPPCGMLAVSAEANTWQEFATAEKKIVFFDYPKLNP
jgi:phosphohistidine phosphatase